MSMIQGIITAILLSFVLGFAVGALTYRKIVIIRRRERIKQAVDKGKDFVGRLAFWRKEDHNEKT